MTHRILLTRSGHRRPRRRPRCRHASFWSARCIGHGRTRSTDYDRVRRSSSMRPRCRCDVGLQRRRRSGPARVHLDIESDDVEAEVARPRTRSVRACGRRGTTRGSMPARPGRPACSASSRATRTLPDVRAEHAREVDVSSPAARTSTCAPCRRRGPCRDDQRHLARGLVDHLVAEHRRALRAAGLGRVVVVRVEDQLGVVVVVLRRRVDLVGDADLVRVQHPLAVEAERGRALRRPRRKPSASRICRYGPSMACLLFARAAIRIDIRMWWYASPTS